MIVYSYYPADPRPRREAEALIAKGMSVDMICLRNNDETKEESINGVQVYRLPVQRKRGQKIRYLWGYGCFIFLSFWKLTFLNCKRYYNIIHVHNMPDILVFTALLPKLLGTKIILDLHDPMPEMYISKYNLPKSHWVIRMLCYLEKLSISFSNMVLTPNVAFRNLFVARSCPENKIEIIMNSPDTAIFIKNNKDTDANDVIQQSDNFVLMYHGTIAERNGLDNALQAIALLKNKIPKLIFHVFGDGDFVPRVLGMINELSLQDFVKYHGPVSLEVIAKAIEKIDLGIVPNKRSPFTEINMPTRIFEYLSMGKPVIAPNTTGIRDYFDRESLPFFEPGDEKSLALSILNLYKNPSLRQDYLMRGNKIYQAHRWELESEKLVNIIRNINPKIYDNKIKSVIKFDFMKFFYFLKPVIPRSLQLKARRMIGKKIRKIHFNAWPIDFNSNNPPENWNGWPEKKKFAVVLRHDVETIYGVKNIYKLLEMEKALGFKSSFNFSPERYNVSRSLIADIKKMGFEVGLHGLKHDGKLYSSRKEFQKRAVRINKYLKNWDISGFASPATHHNFEWISELDILYDSSSYDTDPFEPQLDPVKTIFPFIYTSKETGKKYVELPYTLPQDSTLFLILDEKDTQIWKNKIDWIVENNGMVLLNTHPDYMFFDDNQKTKTLYPYNFYKEVLEYIDTKYHSQFIHYLPCEIAEYWLKR